MLMFFGENADGVFELSEAVSAEINSELGVPADDLTVSFGGELPSLHRIYAVRSELDVYPENAADMAEFCGIVDEQTTQYTAESILTTVCARSPAAIVLDNDCGAVEYIRPSESVIFMRHLKPFGITTKFSEDTPYSGELRAARGSSHYDVVKQFCSACFSSEPRITASGEFRPNAFIGGEPLVFGNSGGIGFSKMIVRSDRYRRISSVVVQTDNGSVTLRDESAVRDGIRRERIIDLAGSSTHTLSDGDKLLSGGNKKASTITLFCPSALGDVVGRSARLELGDEVRDELAVTSVRYRCSKGREETRVELRRR